METPTGEGADSRGPKELCIRWDTRAERHLSNTIERSMRTTVWAVVAVRLLRQLVPYTNSCYFMTYFLGPIFTIVSAVS